MEAATWPTGLVTAMTFADWVTMALAAWAGVQVYRGRPRRIITAGRHRHLSPLLGKERVAERTRVVLDTQDHSPANEVSWLADTSDVPHSLGLEFAATSAHLTSLARAYEGYAARVERGILFGATAAPVVVREVELCHAVAGRLRAAAGRDRFEAQDVSTLHVAHRGLTLELFGRSSAGRDAWQPPDFRARDLDISYRRHRIVAPPRPGVRRALPPVPVGGSRPHVEAMAGVPPHELVAVHQELAEEHFFDGVLPRLLGWRVERDSASGRQSMHLSLAECTYAGVVLDHYPLQLTEPLRTRPVDGSRVRLLTMSAVILTACDHLVFVRRSASSHSHPRKYVPAINGNLELAVRRGVGRDEDEAGFPDPRAALAREGLEELGLRLAAADISLTAVGRFSVPEEANTHVLTGLGVVDLDLDGLLLAMRHADPVEGAWELGGSLLALPYPRSDPSLDEAIAWLTGSAELSPHATLAGLGAMALHSNLPDVFARACMSAGSRQEGPRPEGLLELTIR